MAADIEFDLYLRVVDMSAASARRFVGADRDPVDLGPADPDRYKDGARVWGFPSRKETPEEVAARKWGMSR